MKLTPRTALWLERILSKCHLNPASLITPECAVYIIVNFKHLTEPPRPISNAGSPRFVVYKVLQYTDHLPSVRSQLLHGNTVPICFSFQLVYRMLDKANPADKNYRAFRDTELSALQLPLNWPSLAYKSC